MLETVARYVLPAAYSILPDELYSQEASAILLAIGLQESGFEQRKQLPIPFARGFWQFELVGVTHVCTHRASRWLLERAAARLCYRDVSPSAIYAALEHNDVLACVCARLLLWTRPESLTGPGAVDDAWRVYVKAWRPKPGEKLEQRRIQDWPGNYTRAWEVVNDGIT